MYQSYVDVCVLASGPEGYLAGTVLSRKGLDVLLFEVEGIRPFPTSISLSLRNQIFSLFSAPSPLTRGEFKTQYFDVVLPSARFTVTGGRNYINACLEDLRFSPQDRTRTLGEFEKLLTSLPPSPPEKLLLRDGQLQRFAPRTRKVRTWIRELALFYRVKIEKIRPEELERFFEKPWEFVKASRYFVDFIPYFFKKYGRGNVKVANLISLSFKEKYPELLSRELVCGGFDSVKAGYFVVNESRLSARGLSVTLGGLGEVQREFNKIFGPLNATIESLTPTTCAFGKEDFGKIKSQMKHMKIIYCGPEDGLEFITQKAAERWAEKL